MIDRQEFPELQGRLLGLRRLKLREGLQNAFQTHDVLQRFVQEVLGISLNDFTNESVGISRNIDALMTHMDQDGRVMQLVSSARAERPRNAALREVEEMLLLTFDPYADVHVSSGVKSQVNRGGVESIVVASAGFASAAEFLSRLGEAEFRVCTIGYSVSGAGKYFGTGFLIGNDLVMTNEHVVQYAYTGKSPFTLSGSSIEVSFDFRTASSMVECTTLAATGWLVASDPGQRADGSKGLDYAILRLAKEMGDAQIGATSGAARRGFFRTVVQDLVVPEPLLILHHPFDVISGKPSPMQLTIGFVSETENSDIRHTANTLKGSSGSPVFNSHCEVVGLHYWGDDGFNAAKKIEAIKADLASKNLAHLLV